MDTNTCKIYIYKPNLCWLRSGLIKIRILSSKLFDDNSTIRPMYERIEGILFRAL